jgi:hypothetical protein
MPVETLRRAGFFPGQAHHLKISAFFTMAYLLWTSVVVGLRLDHLQFLGFLLLMVVLHNQTRALAYSFVFFILFWIIYDSMRILPNYEVNPVHIIQPYQFEKEWFGFDFQGMRLTPNEFLRNHAHPAADFLAGLFYLTWVPVPLGLGLYLFYRDKSRLLQFSAAFLFANLLGFVAYYIYPAAPPWYFDLYGDVQRFDIPGHAAQLLRFDQLIGSPLFENMYTRNANVFAAIPSLHAAYPVVTWYYARKAKLHFFSWFVVIDILGIWFAAVYSFHHYVLDVILGAGCAVLAIFLFEVFVLPGKGTKWLGKYQKLTQ